MRRRRLRSRTLGLPTLALVAIAAGAVSFVDARPSDDETIAEQRALFLSVYRAAERGDWSPVWELTPGEREALERYVLWPDLRAAYLKANLRDAEKSEVDAYLDEYGATRPARELRYRYALNLGRQSDVASFNEVYRSFYQGRGIARLDCLALAAEVETGNAQSVALRAKDLWLVPRSQVDECDPLFDALKARGLLDRADHERRYQLAIDARNFTLARWLGKSIDEAHEREARRWLAAQSDPETFLERYTPPGDPIAERQLVYAVERLTYRDPIAAAERWAPVKASLEQGDERLAEVDRHIALWTARDRLDGAYALLEALPDSQQDLEVLRWRARSSIRDSEWTRLMLDIALMPDAERLKPDWQYWRAVALEKTGNAAVAAAVYASLASDVSYHGFLAADAIGAPYALGDAVSNPDPDVLAEVASRPDLVRARELFYVGLDGRGRSEWDAAIARLTTDEKYHAAVLAKRWGWHSRAIATVASIGEFDDLELRYPLPFRDEFERYSDSAAIAPTWAYGIARSESLFMRDIRSSAGAIGLMQLMPATGRRVARGIELPYRGLDTLTDPTSNIRLGTTYLGQMARRYDGNTILATAAYNAGPRRVDAWLPKRGSVDARVWIASIPFNETRGYVRRVMTAEAIFHWRMTGEVKRLSELMSPVDADRHQVASR